jgi:phosphatidate phosphatase APP1
LLSADSAHNGRLAFQAVTREGDSRAFSGVIRLLEPTGLSIISDVDDTIKVSEVRDRKALLSNTFVRQFRAVPGMADVYAEWARRGVRFHYLTASPWQLYEPLSEFLRTGDFPPATTFHMRIFRWKDTSAIALFSSSEDYKRQRLQSLIEAFPRRRFVLVGDSGERDPEIYGAMARQHAGSVQRVLIRDVAGEGKDSARIQKAFDGVPPAKWMLFRDASEIRDVRLDSTDRE